MRTFRRYSSDIPIEIIDEESHLRPLGPLHDVSYGGLACSSDVAFEPGALVKVRISQLSIPFEGDGIVIWCEPKGDGFEVGIQFREGREAFTARMVAQVCQIEVYKKKVLETEGRSLTGDEAAMEWIAKNAHKNEMQERAFIRHPIDIPIEIAQLKKDKFIDSKLCNFSVEGACIISSTAVEVGQYVCIRLPGIEGQEDHAAEGSVMWCKQQDGQYELGVKFRESDEAYYSGLLKQISQIVNFKEEVQQLEGRELSGEDAVQEYMAYISRAKTK